MASATVALSQQQQQQHTAGAGAATMANGSKNGVSYQTKRNQAKKLKKKLKKQTRREGGADDADEAAGDAAPATTAAAKNEITVEVDYVPTIDFDMNDPNNAELAKVYQRFQEYAAEANKVIEDEVAAAAEAAPAEKTEVEKKEDEEEDKDDDDDDDDKDAEDGFVIGENGQRMSKKKLRKLRRMTIADLKQRVKKPEVVEWVDVTAADPILLVHFKSYRNSVPVPRHWSIKRKYLQNKRGIEKPPFELPDFIKHTGITEMRDALREKEETMKLRQKARERMQPKMGKLEIDYQKLHDAFFRFQTKPHLTNHGDMYYEGKEFEVQMKEMKPGVLSTELKAALGMPEGAPPPWLINMQRYGPPPSYPGLRIPGLNAPIPRGAEWGFHPGGWGRPPVDDFGNPLYGDVFGLSVPPPPSELAVPIETKPWGEIEEEDFSDEEEEQQADQDGAEGGEASGTQDQQQAENRVDEDDETGMPKPSDIDGLITPSGFASTTTSGLETPDQIELRKERRGDDTPSTVDGDRPLYTVLPQKETKVSGFMGSAYVYDFNSAKKPSSDDVQVALDPSEMESLDEAALRAKYEQSSQGKTASRDDMSDMVAEHAAKADKKRKAAATKATDSKAKKLKDFKF